MGSPAFPLEQKVGIELYLTKNPGIGGKIRQQIEDFYVEEITSREEGAEGKYLILELTKRDWDTHHLIRELSRALGVSQKRFGFAGTKDKRALTKQKISIWDVNEDALKRINLPGVELRVVGRSNKKVVLGNLWGNKFRIVIRDVESSLDVVKERVKSITDEIAQMGGIPNFFGMQRFGVQRPVTHLVGEAIVRGDLKKAVLTYLAEVSPNELEDVQNARSALAKDLDFQKALKEFPLFLRYERAMLNVLVQNPEDYLGALGALPQKLQQMFVHAYQSCIFNKILSERLRKNLSLNSALPGDIVCFPNKTGLPNVLRTQRVKEDNVEGMNNLITRKRAFVTAPLFGYESQFADGVPGEIERSVIESMKIEKDDFRIPEAPELASKGRRREILCYLCPSYEVKQEVVLQFSLPKGSYATTVLREYMKTDPLSAGY
ncbi:MAG: tRNA pseudouridine(13) synthase TruD [Methanosarcinales archaeon]|nr:MAG: tRNA pseudouridine(13) synthase TruD [Methanosarcinales archaeon]